jgi:thiamine-monophosphate kinase
VPESALLAHIEAASRGMRLDEQTGWRVVIGPGDDAAELVGPSGRDAFGRERDARLLVTVDQVVGGRHFDAASTPVELIARKAVARSVSDIAAMGGRPAWGLATGVLPAGYARARELFDAMRRWADAWGCPLVGGDVAFHGSAADPMVLTVTVAGVLPSWHDALTRGGASVGDVVYVTGAVGGSLASGRHLTFEPRVEAGLVASQAGSVTAAIDVSDGLGRDAGRVGRASGVVVRMEAGLIPVHAERAGDVVAACADGEDHELVLTVMEVGAEELEREMLKKAGVRLVRIGVCEAPAAGQGGGAVVVMPDGRVVDVAGLGWDHAG